MKTLFIAFVLTFAACGGTPPSKGKSNGPANNTTANNTTANNTTANNTTTNNTTANNTIAPINNETCEGCLNGDTCAPGDSELACGAGGEQCLACADGWLCFDGSCVEPPTCDAGNCAGCCDAVRGCVTGADATACGAGGEACSACVGNETCDGTACIAPCSETCPGCCDGETCHAGTGDTACGTGGASCEACGDAASCSAQSVCVPDACATTCAGCCDGNTCLTGNGVGACGNTGDACVACGTGRTCMNQACVTDPASTWELVLISGEVSPKNQSGEFWDIIGSADPVVDFELYDSSTSTAYRASSSVIQDDNTPTWNESILTNVPARAFMLWKIDVFDSDIDPDDFICSISIDLSGDPATYQDLFSGAAYTFSCSDPGTGVFANINVRLQ